MPALREIRSYGETVTPKPRRLVHEAWGVPLTDVYSAQEVGYIAMQCCQANRCHLQCEHLLVEILDEAGKPCAPGEIGRIVLTTLLNFASPLIRYELGDYAEVGDGCECGRGLPVIRRVLGRERNLVTLPDGRKHWPSFPEHDWMEIAPIRQLHLVQKTPRKIEARVVASREMTENEQSRLANVFAASIGYPFEFNFTYHNEIPRGKKGKFEDFVSEVGWNDAWRISKRPSRCRTPKKFAASQSFSRTLELCSTNRCLAGANTRELTVRFWSSASLRKFFGARMRRAASLAIFSARRRARSESPPQAFACMRQAIRRNRSCL